jgi:hypothetical protein
MQIVERSRNKTTTISLPLCPPTQHTHFNSIQHRRPMLCPGDVLTKDHEAMNKAIKNT